MWGLEKPPFHPLPQATLVQQQQHSIFKTSRIMKEKIVNERLATGIPWVHPFTPNLRCQHLYCCCCSLDGVHETNTLRQVSQGPWGLFAMEVSVAVLGTTFDDAGVLFPLYLKRDRISVKYFVAGVKESGIKWQFWKKCWNGNMLLSPPSGEETQNHPFLASCSKNKGECVWGFVEDKF